MERVGYVWIALQVKALGTYKDGFRPKLRKAETGENVERF